MRAKYEFDDWPVDVFVDRANAAEQLAVSLNMWRGARPLVIGIPRGGVPMGRIIADRLEGDLDILLTRKLHAPDDPELAIGAVDESGCVRVSEAARRAGVDADYIQARAGEQAAEIRRRRALYTANRSPIDPRGRVVIVVDDGVATGATMMAALQALRLQHPRRLICAVPVASREAAAKVRGIADDAVILRTPVVFDAVSQFYGRFPQVEDEEVIAALDTHRVVPRSVNP